MLKDLVLVQNFDGNGFAGLNIFCDLDFCKSTFSESFSELIFSDAHTKIT